MAFGFLKSRSKNAAGAGKAELPAQEVLGGLAQLIRQEVKLQSEREAVLRRGMDEGLAFYQQYNDSRLELAFGSFDDAMRMALFEIIYLLHTNDPSLSEIRYTGTHKDNSTGVPRYLESPCTANLYFEGAPHGVRSLRAISEVFLEDFEKFIAQEFGGGVANLADDQCPIVCLQSIGSIGTISHKSGSSDLDLQVVYDLNPHGRDAENWDDDAFREALKIEQEWWVRQLEQQQTVSPEQPREAGTRQKLIARAAQQVAKSYPLLHKYLHAPGGGMAGELDNPDEGAMRLGLADELMQLADRHFRLAQRNEIQRQEELLKERVEAIQRYIAEKYFSAEIYMFTCALERYRAGRYTSSLEFKESSGSAYELILNYETLMPGIQFTPTVPAHFVFPQVVNNNPGFYQRLNRYIKFDAIGIYREVSDKLVDLGHTPDLDTDYVADHRGAVYWEAFKASSGNLPKATLNLLRYEMLLEKRYLMTIMQIIKSPGAINDMASPMATNTRENRAALENNQAGVPNWVLLDLEAQHPQLLQDPWWLRYKALKIGFAEPEGVTGMEPHERNHLSRTIDLAFALHVRISDVFSKPGDTRRFDSHREQVLRKFLEYSFPPGTEKRSYLEHIFAGEVRAVNRFESELRASFRMSLERTQHKIAQFDVTQLRRTSKEVQLWHAFYQENFEPKPNVVQRTIMNHLKVSRGRLVTGYLPGEGWYFKSLQRESQVGKRFDTFGILSHLPEEVTLVDGSSFLSGLANCIVNGYYGILNRGSLKESRTVLEFDGRHMDMGDKLDNSLAFVRPDNVDRILDRVLEFFPYVYHDYMDFLRVERKVEKIFLFLNLWKFGSLSILYRDTLGTWYCDEFDNPKIKKKAGALHNDHMALLKAAPLHETLDQFLREHSLYINEVELETWVNPHSTETKHLGSKIELKEKYLAEAFKEVIMNLHPSKGA